RRPLRGRRAARLREHGRRRVRVHLGDLSAPEFPPGLREGLVDGAPGMRSTVPAADPAGRERQAVRILIFGNSGSGKSTLARRIAKEHGLPHLDLDAIVWEP